MTAQEETPGAVERIAQQGNAIYQERYKQKLESEHQGKFVAIDIIGGVAYLGEFAEDAIQKGREEAPYGVFHLIRIGHPGVFRIGRARSRKSLSSW